MHSAVQTVAVTIISYKPLSDVNFAGTQLHALFSFGVYKPLATQNTVCGVYNLHHCTL